MKNQHNYQSMFPAFLAILLVIMGSYHSGSAQIPLTSPIQCNTQTSDAGGWESSTDVAMNTSGSYVVGWDRHTGPFGLNNQSSFIRLFNSSGNPTSSEIQLNTNSSIENPEVAMTNAGNAVVLFNVYTSNALYNLKVRRYSAAGSQVGSEIAVADNVSQSIGADIEAHDDGRFCVSYVESSNVKIKMYSATGSLLSTTTVGAGGNTHLDIMGNNLLVVYPNGTSFYARRYTIGSSTLTAATSAMNVGQGMAYEDPVALRTDGSFVLARQYGSNPPYIDVRNSSGGQVTTIPVTGAFYGYVAVDCDASNRIVVYWNGSNACHVSMYGSNNALLGTYSNATEGGYPSVATKNCNFVVASKKQVSSTLTVWSRVFSCSNCTPPNPSINITFTPGSNCAYSFSCSVMATDGGGEEEVRELEAESELVSCCRYNFSTSGINVNDYNFSWKLYCCNQTYTTCELVHTSTNPSFLKDFFNNTTYANKRYRVCLILTPKNGCPALPEICKKFSYQVSTCAVTIIPFTSEDEEDVLLLQNNSDGSAQAALSEDLLPHSLNVSPNPAQNEVTLRFLAEKATSGRVMIADIAGKIVYQQTESFAEGENNIQISLSGLPAGMYVVRLHNGGQWIHQKLLIQNRK
jgi:hypothetical protein